MQQLTPEALSLTLADRVSTSEQGDLINKVFEELDSLWTFDIRAGRSVTPAGTRWSSTNRRWSVEVDLERLPYLVGFTVTPKGTISNIKFELSKPGAELHYSDRTNVLKRPSEGWPEEWRENSAVTFGREGKPKPSEFAAFLIEWLATVQKSTGELDIVRRRLDVKRGELDAAHARVNQLQRDLNEALEVQTRRESELTELVVRRSQLEALK